MVTSQGWIDAQGDICCRCGHERAGHDERHNAERPCRLACNCKGFYMPIERIILTSVGQELIGAWRKCFHNVPGVEIYTGSILDLEVDAIVSPANSFGFMDGGIDSLYTRHFGPKIQDRLQEVIREHHDGELLVGNAEIIPTDNERIPHIIAAPTMRVPMILGSETVAPYLAARAVLRLIKSGKMRFGIYAGLGVSGRVSSVAFPGLGTGVGRVPAVMCALQVRKAVDAILFAKEPYPLSWHDAQTKHQAMYTNVARDLQRPG